MQVAWITDSGRVSLTTLMCSVVLALSVACAVQRGMGYWHVVVCLQWLAWASGAKIYSLQKGQVVDPVCLVLFVTGHSQPLRTYMIMQC
jgi:hypothetical protein